MNTSRISSLVVMIAVMFGGSVCASQGGYTFKFARGCYNKLPRYESVLNASKGGGVTLGTNYIASEINKSLKLEHPLAKAVTQTGTKIGAQYFDAEGRGNSLRQITSAAVPYFVVNGTLRTAVKASGYDVKNIGDVVPNCWAKEKAKNLIEFAPEVTEETAYDVATAATLTGIYSATAYVAPYAQLVAIEVAKYFSNNKS